MYRHRDGLTAIVTAHHLERKIVVEVAKHIVVIVDTLLVQQLLAQGALHVKGIRNAGTSNTDREGQIRTLGGFESVMREHHFKRKRFLKRFVVMKDALGGLHRKTRKETDQTDQDSHQSEKDPKIAEVALQIDRIGETHRGEPLGALFDGSGQQGVFGIGLRSIGQLQRIEQLVLNIREKTTDQQGRLFVGHALPETDQVPKRHQKPMHQHHDTSEQQQHKEAQTDF